jgi:hypothetical protein
MFLLWRFRADKEGGTEMKKLLIIIGVFTFTTVFAFSYMFYRTGEREKDFFWGKEILKVVNYVDGRFATLSIRDGRIVVQPYDYKFEQQEASHQSGVTNHSSIRHNIKYFLAGATSFQTGDVS